MNQILGKPIKLYYLEDTIIDPLTPPIQDNATQIGINHPSHSGNVRLATSIATASELKKQSFKLI